MAATDVMCIPANIITLCIGQAGVQMANGMWELTCMEHGISPNGQFLPDCDPALRTKLSALERFEVFYYYTGSKQAVPRALMLDLEPTVIDEIKTGSYRDLFHPSSLVTGPEDAANNYARGHYTCGKSLINRSMEEVRKQANRCDILQGFHFINGIGGGTGSGFGALMLEKLSTEYGKCMRMMMNIFPSPNLSTATVEPYNSSLAIHATMDHSDLNITLDNEALYKVVSKQLHKRMPTYNDINRLMSQITSSITCSLRFPCSINVDMNQLMTNLVPFPRIHFPICGLAPIISNVEVKHETMDIKQMIKDLFEEETRLVSCNFSEGRYMSCNVLFRGCVSPKDVNVGVAEIKRNTDVGFVDWCPTGFKIGICSQPPLAVPESGLARVDRSCTMLANNTAISEKWRTLMNKFDQLYSKRSFVHWFVGEGMEEAELSEARNDMVALVTDYEGAGKNNAEMGGEGNPGSQNAHVTEEGAEMPDEIAEETGTDLQEDTGVPMASSRSVEMENSQEEHEKSFSNVSQPSHHTSSHSQLE